MQTIERTGFSDPEDDRNDYIRRGINDLNAYANHQPLPDRDPSEVLHMLGGVAFYDPESHT